MSPLTQVDAKIGTQTISAPSELSDVFIGTAQAPNVAKPFIDQIRQDQLRKPLPVHVTQNSQGVHITSAAEGDPSAVYLHAPVQLPESLNKTDLLGDIRIGGFTFCEAEDGQVLFILKKKGNFWYLPGGLMEKKDGDLWRAAKREFEEETGVLITGEGRLAYLYNSIFPPTKPERQNLMAFYFHTGRYNTKDPLIITKDSEGEVERAQWWKPTQFWAQCLKQPRFSLPSIRLAFDEYVKSKQRQIGFDKEKLGRYMASKEQTQAVYPSDPLLLDLCFIELMQQTGASVQDVGRLTQEAAKNAQQILGARL